MNMHCIPVNLQLFYWRKRFRSGQFPDAEAYAKEAISVPQYFWLTNENHDFIVNNLKSSPL